MGYLIDWLSLRQSDDRSDGVGQITQMVGAESGIICIRRMQVLALLTKTPAM
jgi:hypothetical protein